LIDQRGNEKSHLLPHKEEEKKLLIENDVHLSKEEEKNNYLNLHMNETTADPTLSYSSHSSCLNSKFSHNDTNCSGSDYTHLRH